MNGRGFRLLGHSHQPSADSGCCHAGHRPTTSAPIVGNERFDGAEFLVDLREGGAAVMWLAWAGQWGLRAPVFKMGQQGLVAQGAGCEGTNNWGGLHLA